MAPPAPVTPRIDRSASQLRLPVVVGPAALSDAPVLVAAPPVDDDRADVVWRIERDVLAASTACVIDHGARTETDEGIVACERYEGRVTVADETFAQTATARHRFDLDLVHVAVSTETRLDVRADASALDVTIDLDVWEGAERIEQRQWHRRIARDLQ